MEEGIVIQNKNLPNKIEDLAKFVLVGREKLVSVRAEIRAINKLELAEEVREQKKEEAQMLAEALIDAEVRIGDLLKTIPKAQGTRTDINKPIDIDVVKLETKKEAIERLGFNQKQAERFETLASNKDIVEQVKAEARENEAIFKILTVEVNEENIQIWIDGLDDYKKESLLNELDEIIDKYKFIKKMWLENNQIRRIK